MKIEFDPAKRKATLEHRGLDMARAEDFRRSDTDHRGRTEELRRARFITIGRLDGRMVVSVWTPRGAGRRLISLRKANDREQALYGDRLD